VLVAILATKRNPRQQKPRTRQDELVCLVGLVCLVYLVDLVHLVNFVQPNKQNRPNKPNNGFLYRWTVLNSLVRLSGLRGDFCPYLRPFLKAVGNLRADQQEGCRVIDP
jgi:hypothetical protein